MPILVDIRDASGSDQLTKGCTFYWNNPTGNQVTLSSCGGFCTQTGFIVQANSTTAAQILQNPTGPYTFGDTGWTAPGMPHISAPTMNVVRGQDGPPEPYIDLTDGSVTPEGGLQKGQPFYWYNPTDTQVTVNDCGTWCEEDSYTIDAGSWTEATILLVPNPNAYAFTEDPNEWDAPGMPHISAPTQQITHEKKEKEVA
jgi:hypothetical protein